jgi:hypothetical protein
MLDNRPFLRALHGIAISLWRLQRIYPAQQMLLNMLWLNPMDNQRRPRDASARPSPPRLG